MRDDAVFLDEVLEHREVASVRDSLVEEVDHLGVIQGLIEALQAFLEEEVRFLELVVELEISLA